jgi:hypothetical protein
MLLYRQGQIYPKDVFKSGPVSSGNKKTGGGEWQGNPELKQGMGMEQ